MAISNCASCGADSYANPLTGIVTRQNKMGETVPASVRPNGIEKPINNIAMQAVSLSSQTTSSVLQISESESSLKTVALLNAYK